MSYKVPDGGYFFGYAYQITWMHPNCKPGPQNIKSIFARASFFQARAGCVIICACVLLFMGRKKSSKA